MSPPCPRQHPRPQRSVAGGQVLPLLAVALVVAGLIAAGLARVAVAGAQRGLAQAAADAAALAGAAEGPAAARTVAAANGATVRSYREVGGDVVVVVERRGATARARARWQADEATPPPGGSARRAIP